MPTTGTTGDPSGAGVGVCSKSRSGRSKKGPSRALFVASQGTGQPEPVWPMAARRSTIRQSKARLRVKDLLVGIPEYLSAYLQLSAKDRPGLRSRKAPKLPF